MRRSIPGMSPPMRACRWGSSRASSSASSADSASTASTRSPGQPAGIRRLVRISRPSPACAVSALTHLAPAVVAPLAGAGEQGLGVVDDEKQAVPLHQPVSRGKNAASCASSSELVGHLEAVQVALQREREVGQRPGDVHALVGRLVPDQPVERVLLAVGELQRAGGLPAARHPVQQHARDAAAARQRGAGPGHHPGAPDETFRLRRESGHLQSRSPDRHRPAGCCDPERPAAGRWPVRRTGLASPATRP